MPKLVNKAFSAKSTQIMHLECHKESYNTALWIRKRGIYTAPSMVTDRQTHRMTIVTLAHAPRVNDMC